MTARKLKINFEKDSRIPTCFVHIVTDEKGKPMDFIFDAVNDSFLDLFKTTRETLVGKRYLECMEDIDLQWIVDVAEVVKTKTGMEKNSHFRESDTFVKAVFSPGSKKGTCSISYFNVTNECRELRYLKEREKMHTLMREIGHILSLGKDYNCSIMQVLTMIQKFFSCDRVFTLRYQDNKLETVHHVKGNNVKLIDAPESSLSLDDLLALKKSFGNDTEHFFISPEMISEMTEREKGLFRQFGIRDFISVPINIDDKDVGIIAMTNFRPERIDDIVDVLIPTAHIISGKLKCYLLERSLAIGKDIIE